MPDSPSPPAALLRLHPDDPVAIARHAVAAGTAVAPGLVTTDAIPVGHKVSLVPIAAGAPVKKYGQVIGLAAANIAAGAHVHTHNLRFDKGQRDRRIGTARRGPVQLPEAERATFDGIVRTDGRVGTRNYVGVLTSVNCSATVARAIADRLRGRLADRWPGVDGVVALTHQTGCGMASVGPQMDLLRRTIAGYARHPNFAGVLIVGLGCEANQIDRVLGAENLVPGDRLRTLVMQDEGGTAATIRRGVGEVEALLDIAAAEATRQPVPASHLTVALQCGGSDAFSGLSANPSLGVAVDHLVAHGGTGVLAETPEIYGAEHLLLARAATDPVGQTLIDTVAWWERYAEAGQASLDNNPTPGNKAGGLTTILEKSLGAVAKAGSTDLVDVIGYAHPATARGLVFMDSPGYDPVSVTGQVASGCNVVVFTTGRGSCFGCIPAPSLKLCTNTATWQRMAEDMDVNCGTVIDGDADLPTLGRRIFDLILATASGRQTASEALGYGEAEFAPWTLGITV